MTYLYVTDWQEGSPVATMKALAEARRLLSNPSDVEYVKIKELSPFPVGADDDLDKITEATVVLEGAGCTCLESADELAEEPDVEITEVDWQKALLYMAYASGNFQAALYLMAAMNRITNDLDGAMAAIQATFPSTQGKTLIDELSEEFEE